MSVKIAAAPARTFQDLHAEPEIQQAVAAAHQRRRNVPGDTLIDVINDPMRRDKLINDNNILKGIRMTSAGPRPSSYELIARPDVLNAAVDTKASIETTVVEAEFTQQLMESNYTSAAVKVSAPFAAASAEYSEEESQKNTYDKKTVMTSSRYVFLQGQIDFHLGGFLGNIEPSPLFLGAINDALGKPTPLEQRESLYEVFEEFGYIFRTQLQIGGVLSGHTSETFERSEDEGSVKSDIKASLEAAIAGWGASGSGGHGNMETTIKTREGKILSVKYLVNGGDYTKIENTDEWIASADESEWWRVIGVLQVVPTINILPEPLRSKVDALMKPLYGKWVDAGPVYAVWRPQPPFDFYAPKDRVPDGWFWLGHTAKGENMKALIVKPTLPTRKANRNPALTTGHDEGELSIIQPFPDIPQYQFLSTYVVDGFSPDVLPGSNLAALRPDLILEGYWVESDDPDFYIVHPPVPTDPEDECFELKPIMISFRNRDPRLPRWALKKNVVLFDFEGED